VIVGKRDARIDAYIAKSAEFAQPILTHLRAVVHSGCPEVEETIKWGHPSFTYHGILCGMASFKQHCTFGFWKGSLIVAKNGRPADEAMGDFGRITRLSQLPSRKELTRYLKEAMRLNEEGVKPKKAKAAPRKPLPVPADLAAALGKNRKAQAAFEGFSPSHRREYIEWITEAKREETRARRLAATVEWVAEGKHRNWKYENC
jgi:uncharacterized protein YdeI (YjbR/CyaY-like superfamily)